MNEAQMVESVIKNYPPSEGETFFGQLSGWFGAKTVKDLGVGRTLAMGETLDYGNVHLVSCLTASGNRFALFNPDIGLPDAEAARERLELIAKMKENSSRSGTKKHWQARASLKVAESRARDVYESLTGYAKPRIKKEPKPVLTVEERIQGLNEVNKYAQAENKRLNNSLKASREECNSRDVKIDALQYELTQLRSALEFEREGKKRADALAERMRSYESPEGSGALFTHIARLFDSDSLLGGFPITSLCKLLRITRREAVTVLLDFRAGESDARTRRGCPSQSKRTTTSLTRRRSTFSTATQPERQRTNARAAQIHAAPAVRPQDGSGQQVRAVRSRAHKRLSRRPPSCLLAGRSYNQRKRTSTLRSMQSEEGSKRNGFL